VFGAIDAVVPASWTSFGTDGAVETTPFRSPVSNFHMTCAISRASATMAECTAARQAALDARTGTHA
jgi:NADH-quinone oxidoreductase subunit G